MSQGPAQAPTIHPNVMEIIKMLAAVTNKPSILELENVSASLRATRLANELVEARFYVRQQSIPVIQDLQSANPTIPAALLTRYQALPKPVVETTLTESPVPEILVETLPPAPVFTPDMDLRRLAVIAAASTRPDQISEELIKAMSKLGLKTGDRLLTSEEIAGIVTDPSYWEDSTLADSLIDGLRAKYKK